MAARRGASPCLIAPSVCIVCVCVDQCGVDMMTLNNDNNIESIESRLVYTQHHDNMHHCIVEPAPRT